MTLPALKDNDAGKGSVSLAVASKMKATPYSPDVSEQELPPGFTPTPDSRLNLA